jgi:hypothetical protein
LLGGNGLGILAAAHQAGDLVGFEETVHAQPQAILVAMFARAKIAAGPDREAAQRFSAKLAGSPVHFGSIICTLLRNYYDNTGDYPTHNQG